MVPIFYPLRKACLMSILTLAATAYAQPFPAFAWVSWTDNRLCVATPTPVDQGHAMELHFPTIEGMAPVKATATRKADQRECRAFAQRLAIGEEKPVHMMLAQALPQQGIPGMPAEGIAQLTGKRSKTRQFRVCTTSEGAIGTVWAGKALRSKLLWASYSYAGMDFQANCTPRDVWAITTQR